ncbi:TAXI family TRAP transporter solute-binding subunit [Scytonema millei]|uniref:TAXI family TRAP transporter solute-binding subunit n=1 Tax=Scytonema millei VB511283 TaxID=1245923 RepID=A0A9X5I2S6_9CYAN|nr:TAXI family TRAP transporter solute-binding subunit [Scytonema millei]NHC33226.1 TAXI family TRAP transporter solute-binding subunit [Scytonema millei VB511283]
MSKRLFLLLLVLTALILGLGQPLLKDAAIAQESITVLTARKDSLYYQAATELAASLKDSGFKLDVRESPGSFQNLQQLGSGRADLAFAQQDVLTFLQSLSDESLSRLADNVKVFAPVTNEDVHLIVNSTAKIDKFTDLAGKNVGVGPENSGTYVSAILLYQLHDLDVTQENLVTAEVADAIAQVISGELDAAFYTAGMGAPLLKKITAQQGKNLKLLSINVQSLKPEAIFPKTKSPLYLPATVPGNTYPWQKQAVNTAATFSALFVNRAMEPQKVYDLAKAAYANSSVLKSQNPFWQLFSIAQAKNGAYAKLDYHDGVKKLF